MKISCRIILMHYQEDRDKNVAFASIIAMDSDTFVIDEPTSQLDPDGTAVIFEIIHTLKEQGKTIILVEHKIDLLAEYADEILVLQGGKADKKGIVLKKY